jgi:hypothetical protein
MSFAGRENEIKYLAVKDKIKAYARKGFPRTRVAKLTGLVRLHLRHCVKASKFHKLAIEYL